MRYVRLHAPFLPGTKAAADATLGFKDPPGVVAGVDAEAVPEPFCVAGLQYCPEAFIVKTSLLESVRQS